MADAERQHSTALATQERDEDKLAEIGYKQELKRNWSLLHNFGVSFSIIVSDASFQLHCMFGICDGHV